jgi:hypothetical protein
MASKETASSRSGSQESGSSHEGTSPKTPWDTLKSFVREKGGDIYRRGIKLGGTALRAIGAGVEGLRSNSDNSRHIDLSTPDSEAGRGSVEDGQDEVSTSKPESQSGDSEGDEKNDKPVDGGEQQRQEIPEAESRILEGRRKRVEAAKERLADVAKKYGEKSEAYKRAESDLQLREDFLRNLESEFGSPAEHSDETDGDKPEQDRTTPGQGDQEQGTDKGGVPEGFVEDVFVPTDFDGNPEDPAQTETDDSDDQAENNSSAESEQHSKDGGEQNQGSDNISAAIVKARRQAAEELQAKLDSLEPGSKDYEATKAALEESQKRLRHAEKSYIEGKSTVEESSSTAEAAKKGTDDSVEKTELAGDTSKVETADDGSESESADDSAEVTKKDLKKERSAVAKELAEAMRQLSKHNTSDPDYDKLLKEVEDLRNRFNYIGKQINGELDTDEESDGDKEKGKEPEPKGKELVPYDSRVADLDKVINDPEADGLTKYEEIIELKQKVIDARNKYAEIRAAFEQTGMFKKLLKGKELKKRMELARAELEGYMTQLVYQQKDQERSIIVNGVEGANEEEQKEARQKAIQSIAAAVLEQHALVDEKTQEEYDKRLDERSLFKKVAAKIGQWFVGKENKDGGKLGLGGWLRSGGAGLAAGVTLGIFGVSFPISSVVGSVSSAGVKVAAHQRALENARGEKRKLSGEELARFASGAQDLEWTTEEKDGSDRKDQSKEAVASMVGAALAETQKDSVERQKNLTAIGSKAAMGWGLGLAVGRVSTELIKSHIIPDQKPANIADTSGGKGTTLQEGQQGLVSPNTEATQPNPDMLNVPEVTVTPPSETVSLGSDGWVWDRVADVLGAEKATPFLEQLAQTNPDFQLIDLPNGLTGIAYQGNTDPQVVADAIGKVAPDLLKQWVLKA